MKILIYLSFLVVLVISCKKEVSQNPDSFLMLKVQGQDEDIRWETLTSNWDESSGDADIEASSYYFDRCTIHLKHVGGVGQIGPVMLTQFYYTDGIDFIPYAVSGTLTITQANKKEIEGEFSLHLKNKDNGSDNVVTGRFGIINP